MTGPNTNDHYPGEYFGIEIIRSTPEIAEIPPHESAAQALARAVRAGDAEQIALIETADRNISSIMRIEELRNGVEMGLTDLYTADQLGEINRRITVYLGKSLESHIADPGRPTGFNLYVKRLGLHFSSANDDIIRRFGDFERQHENPVINAIGPREQNSRNLALLAIETMQKQFENYYQTKMRFTPVGPTKVENGSRVPVRGIAECQFLVMDYTRDLLAHENASRNRGGSSEVMTLNDIEANIMTLITQRKIISTELAQINPMLGSQIDELIGQLNALTIPVMHRGRPGVPKFRRDPHTARSLMTQVETILMHAEAMAQTSTIEEEIPVLES